MTTARVHAAAERCFAGASRAPGAGAFPVGGSACGSGSCRAVPTGPSLQIDVREAVLAVVDGGELAQLLQRVPGLDVADRARLRAHDQRTGPGALAAVGHAAQHVAVGDAGGDEVAVVRADQV